MFQMYCLCFPWCILEKICSVRVLTIWNCVADIGEELGLVPEIRLVADICQELVLVPKNGLVADICHELGIVPEICLVADICQELGQ